MSLFETVRRVAVDIFSDEGLKKRFESGKELRVKMGADPSAPDLHLGHSVPLRMMRKMQDAGHKVVFIIGDFTGMVGDPSGRNKTRAPLTFEQTRENGKSYLEQVTKILDPNKLEIIYNSEWLNKMNFADILQLTGKYTVARILERDDFSKRYSANAPIGMHELLYPLMQGYDSVAIKADIEIGGTDQTFNLLVGRDLQKAYDQEPQEVITFPLLPGLDGADKMGKSLNNYIGIAEPPGIIFEKCMKVPDNIIEDYFRLTTDIPEDEYTALIKEDIRKAHFIYAREIVKMYHGESAIEEAEARYHSIASGKAPENMKEIKVSAGAITIIDLLKLAAFSSSNSDARRLIEGGGIKINGEQIKDISHTITEDVILSRGKNKFVQVRF